MLLFEGKRPGLDASLTTEFYLIGALAWLAGQLFESLEDLADMGGKVQEAALRAGYGPTIRADSVKRHVESVVNYQTRTHEIIEEMRTSSTRNAQEIRDAVEDGKQRMARLAEQGNALLSDS